MATKHQIGRRRRIGTAAAFFAVLAVAVLLAQHRLAPAQAMAAPERRADPHSAVIEQSLVAQQMAPPDRAAVVSAYLGAINNGDVDGAAALFAGNAVFITANCSQAAPCTDAASIRQQLASDVAGHICRVLRSLTVSGAVVTGQLEIRNDVLRSRGIDYDLSDFIALVPTSQIAFYAAVDDTADPRNALNIAIRTGAAQPANPPIPNPPTPCAGLSGA
jgi:hypothetical protein